MTGIILGALFGLFLLFLVGQALWGPFRFILKLGFRFAIGGLALYAINICTAFWGWSIAVNPLSIMLVGLLGLPGVLLLSALKLFFGSNFP